MTVVMLVVGTATVVKMKNIYRIRNIVLHVYAVSLLPPIHCIVDKKTSSFAYL